MIGQKTGGRKAGTPNRKTELLIKICEEEKFEPFRALISLAKHRDLNIRLPALKECCGYLYPKLKSIECHSDTDRPYSHLSEEALNEKVAEALRLKGYRVERIAPN